MSEPFYELLADYTRIFEDQVEATSESRTATKGMVTALYDTLRGRQRAVAIPACQGVSNWSPDDL